MRKPANIEKYKATEDSVILCLLKNSCFHLLHLMHEQNLNNRRKYAETQGILITSVWKLIPEQQDR